MFNSALSVALWQLEQSGYNTEESKAKAIREATTEIHTCYAPPIIQTDQASKLDFSDPKFRSAYLYCYFTSHASLIKNIWKDLLQNATAQTWMFRLQSAKAARVCSLGGGPGSDVFGFCLFLNSIRSKMPVHCDVLDYWLEWEETYKSMARKMEMIGNPLFNTTYKQFDFLEPTTAQDVCQIISAADLVTLTKFISAVGFDKEFCESKLKVLLSQVKIGALVLFVDTCGGGYFELFVRAAKALGLENIIQFQKKTFTVSPFDAMTMTYWRSLTKKQPQTETDVCISVWYKRRPAQQLPLPIPKAPSVLLQHHIPFNSDSAIFDSCNRQLRNSNSIQPSIGHGIPNRILLPSASALPNMNNSLFPHYLNQTPPFLFPNPSSLTTVPITVQSLLSFLNSVSNKNVQ